MTNAEDPVPCSLCGSPGDEKHMAACWSYCTSCGEALDRELVEYERANRTALDTYIGHRLKTLPG